MILKNTGSTFLNKIMQLSIVKKCTAFYKKAIHEIKFKKYLNEIDYQWKYCGGRCWNLFPPSFYYTHTKEEIQCILDELREEIERQLPV